jgi:hypothetical protein
MSFYNEKGQAKGKNATGYENSGSDKAKQWGNVIGDGVAIGGTVGAQAAADIAKITAKKATAYFFTIFFNKNKRVIQESK